MSISLILSMALMAQSGSINIEYTHSLVSTVKVEKKNELIPASGIGVITSADRLNYRSPVEGEVKFVAPAGSSVKAGELLVELDAQHYRNSLRALNGEIRNIQAEIDNLEEKLRKRNGASTGLYSKEEIDTLKFELNGAKGSKDAALARRLTLINTEKYYKVIAAFDGTIENISHEVGDFVSKGNEVFRLSSDGKTQLEVYLPIRFYAFFIIGSKYNINLNGEMYELGLILKSSNEDSGLQKFTATFELPKDRFTSSERVFVSTELKTGNKINSIPKEALSVGFDGASVYGVVETRAKKIKLIDFEIIDNSILIRAPKTLPETIIIEPNRELFNNQKVKIIKN